MVGDNKTAQCCHLFTTTGVSVVRPGLWSIKWDYASKGEMKVIFYSLAGPRAALLSETWISSTCILRFTKNLNTEINNYTLIVNLTRVQQGGYVYCGKNRMYPVFFCAVRPLWYSRFNTAVGWVCVFVCVCVSVCDSRVWMRGSKEGVGDWEGRGGGCRTSPL